VRFEMNCAADRDGRLEGTLAWEDSSDPVSFSGTLELLRLSRTTLRAGLQRGTGQRPAPARSHEWRRAA
jgi:hypothetical protein